MKKKNWFVVLVIFCFALNGNAQHGHIAVSADKSSVHGRIIFGTEKIYASHLPLFHAPHNYQIILELELDKTVKQIFITDQLKHPEFTTYTIEPELFILPDKIQSRGSFKANLYRGHFERGGIKIVDSIKIKISTVIYFKKFDETEIRLTNSAYLLFGNSKEQFAVHQISNKPDFEQIIQVKIELGKNNCDTVIFSDLNDPVGISGNTIPIKTNNGEGKLILMKQLYLEFDDLKE